MLRHTGSRRASLSAVPTQICTHKPANNPLRLSKCGPTPLSPFPSPALAPPPTPPGNGHRHLRCAQAAPPLAGAEPAGLCRSSHRAGGPRARRRRAVRIAPGHRLRDAARVRSGGGRLQRQRQGFPAARAAAGQRGRARHRRGSADGRVWGGFGRRAARQRGDAAGGVGGGGEPTATPGSFTTALASKLLGQGFRRGAPAASPNELFALKPPCILTLTLAPRLAPPPPRA
jgi:hypothetical protein